MNDMNDINLRCAEYDRYDFGFNLMRGRLLIDDTTVRSIRMEKLYQKYREWQFNGIMPEFCRGALAFISELDKGNEPKPFEELILPTGDDYDSRRYSDS